MARNRSVADQLVGQLVAAGVRHICGIVGDSLNPVVDAVRRTAGIDWVQVRHEEAGAFAAAAEAELTDTLAVCAGSCGPGNLHLINGLYDANRSRVPVLAIASHIPSEQIGTQYFQETHPDRLFTECSVYSEMIADLEAPPAAPDILTRPKAPRVIPEAESVRALADAINGARNVTIFAGAGTAAAHDDVIALAEKIAAPIGHSLRGKEHIQYDNPFDVGMSGLLGYGACQAAIEGADLLLMLGTDFPYDQFAGTFTHWTQRISPAVSPLAAEVSSHRRQRAATVPGRHDVRRDCLPDQIFAPAKPLAGRTRLPWFVATRPRCPASLDAGVQLVFRGSQQRPVPEPGTGLVHDGALQHRHRAVPAAAVSLVSVGLVRRDLSLSLLVSAAWAGGFGLMAVVAAALSSGGF